MQRGAPLCRSAAGLAQEVLWTHTTAYFIFVLKQDKMLVTFWGGCFRGSCDNRIVGLGLQMLLNKWHMKPANFVFEILRSFRRPRGLGPQLSLLLTLRGCFNDRMAQGLAPMIRHVQLNIYIYIYVYPLGSGRLLVST